MTYEQLHTKHSVRNIPHVLAAGAVTGEFQVTSVGGRHHGHYQIVLDIIGKSLYDAESTYQFTAAFHSAFLGTSYFHSLIFIY